MIKRIIFDLDNTLIPFREEYSLKLYNIYKKYTHSKINDYEKLIATITSEYDAKCVYYDKNEYLKHINNSLNMNLDNNFIDELLSAMSDFVDEKDKIINDTLNYLSKKYELVVLTNWFREVQIKRLEKLDMLNFFKEIHTCDKIKRKPYDESFLTAKGNHLANECVMIGDDYDIDIKRAKELGFKTVYFTKEKTSVKADYIIRDIKELNNLF